MTTKKSAPATPNDQGKKNVSSSLKDNKSPATSQENIDPDLLKIIQRAQSHAPVVEDEEIQHWEKDQAKLTDYETFVSKVVQAGQIPEQQIFSFMPHQLAKTSIFYPMSGKELTEDRRRIAELETTTAWGKIIVTGIKLAIYEEDIFLALAVLLGKNSNLKEQGKGYYLKTNLNKIVNLLYGSKGYTKSAYERILKTLDHFQLVSFKIITGQWHKKGKEKLKAETTRSFGGIVSAYKYDHETKDIKIWFNSKFFEFFLESMLTNINLTVRRRLKKDGSKALLRFISTHNHPSRMHILTVLNGINYNTNQPLYELRRRLKGFIKELKTQKILGPKTRVYKDDTVYFDVINNYPKSLPKK